MRHKVRVEPLWWALTVCAMQINTSEAYFQGLAAVRRVLFQKRVGESRFPEIRPRLPEIRPTPSRKQFFVPGPPPRCSVNWHKLDSDVQLVCNLVCCSGQTQSPFSYPSSPHSLVRHKRGQIWHNKQITVVRTWSRSCLDCHSTKASEQHFHRHRVCSPHSHLCTLYNFQTVYIIQISQISKDKCDHRGHQQQHTHCDGGEHPEGLCDEHQQRPGHKQGDCV